MKTALPSSRNKFANEKIIQKLFLVISIILLCFGDSLYAGTGPVIKHNKNFNTEAYRNNAVNNKSPKIKHAEAIAPPTISYSGGPQTYLVGTAITTLTPTSSGVAATAYAPTINIGSGFDGPRGLAVDGAGNVFVADFLHAQVKKIPAGGGAPVNWGSGFSQPIGVALDAAGNVYVADYGTANIKRIPPAGGVPVVIATGFTNPVAIASDAAGNVYVADSNTLWRIPFGGTATVFQAGFSGLISLALDPAGNIYAGDSADQRIYKITPGGVPSVFASNTAAPLGIVLDGEGNVFVTDDSNFVLNEIPANGGPVVAVSTFSSIMAGVAIGTDGSLYVSEYNVNAVKKINLLGGYHISPALPAGLKFDGTTGIISGTPMASIPATNFTVTAYNATGSSQATINIKVSALNIAYNGPVTLTTGTLANPLSPISSGVAAAAYSGSPTNLGSGFASRGLARDAAGNIYVADFTNNSIWKIPAGGGAQVKVGPAFVGPLGVAVDAAGNIYVAEYTGNAIKKIPVGGGAVVTVGSGFLNPRGVAVDGAGNIYIVDTGNQAIKEIPVGGGAIINLGSFPNPLAITVDAADNIYFSDAANGIIYKIPGSGGAPVALISGTGVATGIEVDVAGNLFFADGSSNIKELPATGFGIISVGPALNLPSDVVVDGVGNLYVSERNGPTLKKISPTGGYYINALPPGMYFDSATGIMTGTPTLAGTPLFYNITAYNSFGSNSALVSIQVNQLPLPVVNYSAPAVNFSVNTPVPPLAPVSTGVAAPGYSVNTYTLKSGFNNPIGIAVDASSNVIIAEAGTNLVRRMMPGNNNAFVIGNGFNYPSGVAADAAGNVYVTDQLNNSIKKITISSSTITLIASGFNSPCGVAVDAAGNIYVADKGNNAIKKIAAVGGAVTTIGSGFSQPSGVVLDAAGNVYVADKGNNAIKMIPAAGGAPVTLGAGFNQPTAIALDASGNLYIADTGSSTIQKMPATGGTPVIISTSIVHPLGIAVDGNGVVYVTDNINSKIKEIIPSGGYYISPSLPAGLSLDNTTGIISGTPLIVAPYGYYHIAGYNSSGGGYAIASLAVDLFPAPTISYATPQSFVINAAISPVLPVSTNVSAMSFNNTPVAIGTGFALPNGVAVDNSGNVYVADKGNGLVKKIQKVGGATVIIGSGINNPNGIAVDGAGNVFVADNGNNKIYKIPVGGGATTAIGGNGFVSPAALALDSAGNVYVNDNGGNVIKKIPADGTATVTIATGFGSLGGIAVDNSGNIYVADGTANAIVKVPADGTSNIAVASGFNQPIGVAVDAAGNIFVADFNNNAVKMIPVDGSPMVTLGSGFNHPYGVAVDGAGNVYTSDYLNSAVKKIIPVGGYFIGPGLPAGVSFNNNTGAIGGTPTAGSIAKDYIVTGYNVSANNTAKVNITVNLFPPPTLSYSSPKIYTAGKAIPALNPTASGVAAPGFGNTAFTISPIAAPFSIAVDAAGNVYVGDRSDNTIKKIPYKSTTAVIIASGFNNVNGIAADAAGNVYVADANSTGIKKIPAGGGAIVTVGSGFTSPYYVTLDAAGNIYTLDQNGNIYKMNAVGGSKTLVANVPGSPAGIAIDAAGNLFVACYLSGEVRKIPADGSPSVIIYSGLAHLYGIAVDNLGNILVADFDSNQVRNLGSAVPTGPSFFHPTGVALDAMGNLYVAEFGFGLIKKVSRTGGYYPSPTLPAGLVIDANSGVISGTPTAVSPPVDYNIFASNSSGAGTATINIKINAAVLLPNITYTTPQTYTAGTAITPLSPANTGSAIPATIYNTVSMLAGSGAAGSADGTGAAATFKGLMNMATDAAGNVYAADYTGNVIRKITPAGVATTLAGSGVAGNANGAGAAATFNGPLGIALDAAGNVYVGDSGNNLIRKITPGGVVSTFAGSGVAGNANGTGTTATFRSPRGLVIDASGNLYVADLTNNLIRKITPGAVVTTFAGSGAAGSANGTGIAASFNGPIALTTDAAGNIYVADYTGSLIRKITPAAVVTTFAGNAVAGAVDGTGAAASFKNPYAIAIDDSDNLFIADKGNNKIRKITPAGVVTTLAGSGTAGSVNGVGIAAQFNDPRGVAFYQGNLYVADFGGHQVRKNLLTGYTISPALPAGLTFNGNTGVISGTPATASAAANYTVMAYNASGSDAAIINIKINVALVAPNISYTTPQTYTAGTATVPLSPVNTGGAVPATVYSTVSTLAGSGAAGSVDGTGAAATFKGLMNIATDAAGDMYAADYTANVIRKITAAGVVTTFAGSGAAGNANGTGVAATFNGPIGVALDAAGNIYVGDSGNNLIRKITPGGVVTTFAGSGVAGNANGTGIAATFHSPRGLATDASGNLYVADMTNNLVRKITPAAVVTTFAGSGVAGSANGTGIAATFNGPIGLAADGAGNIYVADYTTSLIRKITPVAVVTTFAGSGVAGAVDGTGVAASFKNPYEITADGNNNLFIADRGNNKIRKITPAGVVTTLAGSGTAGSVNAVGKLAQFNDPRGVAFYKGNMYVADFGGHQVRKIILTGYTISPAAPAGLTFNVTTGVLSGTPTAASPATNYTVTAYNAVGSDAAVINILVNAMGSMALAQTDVPFLEPVIADVPTVKQGISPNGDGIGDVLEITNINSYPENTFQVMSRSGVLVYSVKGYDNVSKAFDGHSNINGKLQQAGTYFYQLEYKDKGALKRKTGFILLKY